MVTRCGSRGVHLVPARSRETRGETALSGGPRLARSAPRARAGSPAWHARSRWTGAEIPGAHRRPSRDRKRPQSRRSSLHTSGSGRTPGCRGMRVVRGTSYAKCPQHEALPRVRGRRDRAGRGVSCITSSGDITHCCSLGSRLKMQQDNNTGTDARPRSDIEAIRFEACPFTRSDTRVVCGCDKWFFAEGARP